MTKVYVSMGFFPEDYFQDTVDYICGVQQNDGAIPWFEDGVLDPWDHVEAAMGLTVGGRFDEAKQAYYWLKNNQLPNGSWLAAYKDNKVEDGTRAESNFVAYVATGVWHYYLVTQDIEFLEKLMPVVEAAMELHKMNREAFHYRKAFVMEIATTVILVKQFLEEAKAVPRGRK